MQLRELSSAFNSLSGGLRKTLDGLESTVASRTSELQRLNGELQADIAARRRMEEEREQLIGELRDALAQVKTLSGLLPICASCEKIRDEGGEWHPVEVYVRDRAAVGFSHGICPECARRLYPEVF